jgi:hypothetical protein
VRKSGLSAYTPYRTYFEGYGGPSWKALFGDRTRDRKTTSASQMPRVETKTLTSGKNRKVLTDWRLGGLIAFATLELTGGRKQSSWRSVERMLIPTNGYGLVARCLYPSSAAGLKL